MLTTPISMEPMANRVLIQFAHPAFQKSRVNRRLIAAVRNLENVTLNDLYEEYPDFSVNVPREQQLLIKPRYHRLPASSLLVQLPGPLERMGRPCSGAWFRLRRAGNETQWEMGSDGHYDRRLNIGLPAKRFQLFYDQGTVNALRANRPILRDDLSAALCDKRNIDDARRGSDRRIRCTLSTGAGVPTGWALRGRRV